jgi:hypothetical protein
MARIPGAKSKMIHKLDRNKIGIQTIYDAEQNKSPLLWVDRLVEISGRACYILQVPKNSNFAASDIGHLVSPKLKPLATDITIHKPGPRVNNNLQLEMEDFFNYSMEYYCKQMDTLKGNSLREVQGEIALIIDKINAAILRSIKQPLERTFFYHNSKKNRLCQFHELTNYDGTVDGKLMKHIKKSWRLFWTAMRLKFLDLQKIFRFQSVFKYKEGITYQNKDLTLWLEKGINDFFDTENAKITSDETKIKLLKALIINKDAKNK